MDVETLRVLGQAFIMLAFAYAQYLMMPMRWPAVFFMSVMVVHFFPYAVPGLVSYASSIHIIVLYFVLPLVCYTGSLAARVLAVSLSFSIVVIGEVLMCALYAGVLGQTIGDVAGLYANPLPYFVTQAGDLVFIVLAARAMAPHVRQLLCTGRPPVIVRTLWVVPLCSVSLSLVCTMAMNSFAGQSELLWPYIPFALANLALDVLCLRLMDRSRREAIERERARVMEQQLDAMLSQYDESSVHAVLAARLHHDARNHLQVLERLLNEGDLRRAQEYATALVDVYGRR